MYFAEKQGKITQKIMSQRQQNLKLNFSLTLRWFWIFQCVRVEGTFTVATTADVKKSANAGLSLLEM